MGVNAPFTVAGAATRVVGEDAASARLVVCVGLLALAMSEPLEAHDHAKVGAVSPQG